MRDLSDPISRQQAITALRALSDDDGYINAPHEVVTDVVRGLPSAQPKHDENPCQEQGDSDKFVVKTGKTLHDVAWKNWHEPTLSANVVLDMIRELPPAKPERKTGKWIEQDDGWDGIYYECSVCREPFTLIDGTPSDNLYNFCPNCGADMREGQDDNRRI